MHINGWMEVCDICKSSRIHSFPNSFASNVYLMSALKVKIKTHLAPKSKSKENQSIQAK